MQEKFNKEQLELEEEKEKQKEENQKINESTEYDDEIEKNIKGIVSHINKEIAEKEQKQKEKNNEISQSTEYDLWQTLEDGMDAIDNCDTKENMFSFPYWYDEDLYGMSFEDLCKLDDDERHKLIEEKTGKNFKPDTDTIWIGGNPYLGIKTMEDVDNDLEQRIHEIPYPTDKNREIAFKYLKDCGQWDGLAEPTLLEKVKMKIKEIRKR